MLSVAREMMTEPSLMLVDEPTVGLAPNLVEQVYELLADGAGGDRDHHPARRPERRRGAAAMPTTSCMMNLGTVKARGPGGEFDEARVRALVQECLLG